MNIFYEIIKKSLIIIVRSIVSILCMRWLFNYEYKIIEKYK